MSFSSANSTISSPPATLRTSSPLSELSYYASEPEEHLAEEYALEHESIPLTHSSGNAATPPVTRKKRKPPPPTSWVWGKSESPNGRLVTIADTE